MKIDFNKNNDNLDVILDGRLDTTTAPSLESFLNGNYDSIKALTINCEKLTYISSAGLRVLLAAQKKWQKIGSLKLKNVCSEVMEVFEMTGFSNILCLE